MGHDFTTTASQSSQFLWSVVFQNHGKSWCLMLRQIQVIYFETRYLMINLMINLDRNLVEVSFPEMVHTYRQPWCIPPRYRTRPRVVTVAQHEKHHISRVTVTRSL